MNYNISCSSAVKFYNKIVWLTFLCKIDNIFCFQEKIQISKFCSWNTILLHYLLIIFIRYTISTSIENTTLNHVHVIATLNGMHGCDFDFRSWCNDRSFRTDETEEVATAANYRTTLIRSYQALSYLPKTNIPVSLVITWKFWTQTSSWFHDLC